MQPPRSGAGCSTADPPLSAALVRRRARGCVRNRDCSSTLAQPRPWGRGPNEGASGALVIARAAGRCLDSSQACPRPPPDSVSLSEPPCRSTSAASGSTGLSTELRLPASWVRWSGVERERGSRPADVSDGPRVASDACVAFVSVNMLSRCWRCAVSRSRPWRGVSVDGLSVSGVRVVGCCFGFFITPPVAEELSRSWHGKRRSCVYMDVWRIFHDALSRARYSPWDKVP